MKRTQPRHKRPPKPPTRNKPAVPGAQVRSDLPKPDPMTRTQKMHARLFAQMALDGGNAAARAREFWRKQEQAKRLCHALNALADKRRPPYHDDYGAMRITTPHGPWGY